MLVSTALYKNNKLLLVGCWEDLEYFVEELKRLNPKYIDRREFTIKCEEEIIKRWNRK